MKTEKNKYYFHIYIILRFRTESPPRPPNERSLDILSSFSVNYIKLIENDKFYY